MQLFENPFQPAQRQVSTARIKCSVHANLERKISMKMKIILLGAIALLASACDPDKTADLEGGATLAELGKSAFWAAFYGDKYEDLPAARDLLMRAYEENPKDTDNTLHVYSSWFWTTGELERLKPEPGPQQVGLYYENFLRYLNEARDLNPDDARADGWLGATLVILGRAQNNPELEKQGSGLLEVGKKRWPAFNNFMQVVAYEDVPVTSPQWPLALEGMWGTLDNCIGTRLDRANPDIKPYLPRENAPVGDRACWSSDKVPHNMEGMFLFFGNILVKNGDVGSARVMYANAKLIKGFSNWRDRGLLETSFNADLDARAALYRDADPENDPSTKTHGYCTSCHAR